MVRRATFILGMLIANLIFVDISRSQQLTLQRSAEKILTVSVSSKEGYLKGLSQKDFEVIDGGTLQQITSFSHGVKPMSIGFLVDWSGSMEGWDMGPFQANFPPQKGDNRVHWVISGISSFVDQGWQNNEYFVTGFSEEQRLILDWSSDNEIVRRELLTLTSVKPKGNTRFFDALHDGMTKLSSGSREKKLLIVISDGMDNLSKKYNFDKLKRLSKEKDLLIYFINTTFVDSGISSFLYSDGESVMQTLSKNSGGRVFYATDQKEADLAFLALAYELKSHYQIAFLAVQRKEKDDWHEIKVRLQKETEKKFKGVSVRARKGFYF